MDRSIEKLLTLLEQLDSEAAQLMQSRKYARLQLLASGLLMFAACGWGLYSLAGIASSAALDMTAIAILPPSIAWFAFVLGRMQSLSIAVSHVESALGPVRVLADESAIEGQELERAQAHYDAIIETLRKLH